MIALVGTVVMTSLSWYVSARQTTRAQERLEREERRQQRLEDVLRELKLCTGLPPEESRPT